MTQRHLRIFNNCAELLYESKTLQSFKIPNTPKYLFLKNFSAGEIWKGVVPARTAMGDMVLQDFFLVVYTLVWTLELYQVADKPNK